MHTHMHVYVRTAPTFEIPLLAPQRHPGSREVAFQLGHDFRPVFRDAKARSDLPERQTTAVWLR